MISGGIIYEISYSNEDVGVGVFEGVEGETPTVVLGGLVNDGDANVDGAGTLMITKKMVPGTFEMTVSNDMSATNPAHETAMALSASLKETVWTFVYRNETIYSGTGTIMGTPTLDGLKSSFTLSVASGRGWTRQ